MEVLTKCCKKEMIELGVVSLMDMNTIEIVRYVCGECGKFLDIHTYNLDDEELLREIENYQELQHTKIHRELIKNGN